VILCGGIKKQFPPLFALLLLPNFLSAFTPREEFRIGLQFSGANIKQLDLVFDSMDIMDGIAGWVGDWCFLAAVLTLLPPIISCWSNIILQRLEGCKLGLQDVAPTRNYRW
jgi:hypothetical protein